MGVLHPDSQLHSQAQTVIDAFSCGKPPGIFYHLSRASGRDREHDKPTTVNTLPSDHMAGNADFRVQTYEDTKESLGPKSPKTRLYNSNRVKGYTSRVVE